MFKALKANCQPTKKVNVMHAIRASVLSFHQDPGAHSAREINGDLSANIENSVYSYFADGCVLLNEHGNIEAVGPWQQLGNDLAADIVVDDYSGHLLCPGFIDTHVHGAQLDVIASYGTQLLDWLAVHTFPAEAKFEQAEHARFQARLFFDELLRNGTTSAAVWPTVHEQASTVFFEEAQRLGLRLVSGKVLMDQHCPNNLRDENLQATEQILRAQIERWHGQDRLSYALTPRFAVATSEPLMQLAGRLFAEIPGLYMQNHVAENKAEVQLINELYPAERSYLALYERMGFCAPRSIFAHCIWFDQLDWNLMQRSGSAIAFCPSSNLFLGSGFFDLTLADQYAINVGLASDVGGGTSLNMLQTMSSAYLVQQQLGASLHPLRQFYLATLGGAKVLDWQDKVGRVMPGYEADLVVLQWASDPVERNRQLLSKTLADRLFSLSTLGGRGNVVATYVRGKKVGSSVHASSQ
jgi:guanine deaminase